MKTLTKTSQQDKENQSTERQSEDKFQKETFNNMLIQFQSLHSLRSFFLK